MIYYRVMRILHVGKHYPPHYGGMETALQNIAEGLLDAGDEVTVLVAGSGSLQKREVIRGAGPGKAGTLVRVATLGHLNSQPLTLDLVHALRCAVREFQPELIHLHLPNPLAAAAWLIYRKLEGGPQPVLAVWHHADMRRQRLGRQIVRPLIIACLGQAAGVCVSSPAGVSARELAGVRPRVRVIPFGIDLPAKMNLQTDHRENFLFIGRLVPYKGLPILLRALARVPAARLDIVGTGPQASELKQLVFALDLADRVHFSGDLPWPGLNTKLAEARALVLPSIDASETFGLVQLEAMAAGTAVIASDLKTGIAGVGEFGVTGLLVIPGDSADLADALAKLQQDPGLAIRMGAAGRKRYLELFTRQRMITELRSWYRDLLQSRARKG